METLAERRAREARERAERERKMKELQDMMKGNSMGGNIDIFCIKIAETCKIAPEKEYSI